MQTLDMICQIMIFACGGGGIYMISRGDRFSKWGFVACMMAQPFWLASAWMSRSWGIFAVSAVYTLSYLNGIRNWFWKKGKK
jgi:hypothetical protein